jgi:hypothetical protein
MQICVENALIKRTHISHFLSMYQPVKLRLFCLDEQIKYL